MISNERKKELKEKLAIMIDLAWRSDEYDPDEPLSEEESEYVEKRVYAIIFQLV